MRFPDRSSPAWRRSPISAPRYGAPPRGSDVRRRFPDRLEPSSGDPFHRRGDRHPPASAFERENAAGRRSRPPRPRTRPRTRPRIGIGPPDPGRSPSRSSGCPDGRGRPWVQGAESERHRTRTPVADRPDICAQCHSAVAVREPFQTGPACPAGSSVPRQGPGATRNRGSRPRSSGTPSAPPASRRGEHGQGRFRMSTTTHRPSPRRRSANSGRTPGVVPTEAPPRVRVRRSRQTSALLRHHRGGRSIDRTCDREDRVSFTYEVCPTYGLVGYGCVGKGS